MSYTKLILIVGHAEVVGDGVVRFRSLMIGVVVMVMSMWILEERGLLKKADIPSLGCYSSPWLRN